MRRSNVPIYRSSVQESACVEASSGFTNTQHAILTLYLDAQSGVIKTQVTESGDRWEKFRSLYEKSKVQELNESGWTERIHI